MGKEQWQQESFLIDARPAREQRHRQLPSDRRLREAIEPYVDVPKLRQLASDHARLEDALRTGDIPEEISWLLSLLATVLKPIDREQVRSPSDIASFLQVSMGHECQEQLCVVCLNNKNRVQKIQTVYKGNVNSAMVRPGEVFREPVRLNSVAVIVAHQHPSGDCTPSPEDVLITGELRKAGTIFDIELLDSMIITPHKYVSLRERGLGFDKP
jgi:hypothetical protein